jgi:hypothetical protein
VGRVHPIIVVVFGLRRVRIASPRHHRTSNILVVRTRTRHNDGNDDEEERIPCFTVGVDIGSSSDIIIVAVAVVSGPLPQLETILGGSGGATGE